MGIKVANNAFATLAAGISNSDTSITVSTGQGARFPVLGAGDYFYATLINTSNQLEIVQCTARSTDVLTVVRAQEATVARAYEVGDRIEIRITAQTFADATSNAENFAYTGTLTGGTGVVNLGSGQLFKDASGNVGIGTSSPGAKLDVFTSAAANVALFRAGAGQNSFLSVIGNGNSFLSTSFDIIQDTFNQAQLVQRANAPMLFFTNNIERMRIDSAGNVGIGTSSPATALYVYRTATDAVGTFQGLQTESGGTGKSAIQFDVNGKGGFAIANDSTSGTRALTFSNNSGYGVSTAEAMRIDSSGNLLVGTTSGTGGRIVSEVNSGFNTAGANNWKNGAFNGRGSFGGPFSFINTGGASDGFVFYLTGTPSQLNIQFGANGGAVSAGVFLASTATAWAAQSDERLKDITSTITSAVQSVQSLRPVKYTFKSDQDKTQRVGLIAQDVQKVLPEAIDVDDKGYLGVRYSEIVPLLVAAIQEQQAIIESLKARLDAANL